MAEIVDFGLQQHKIKMDSRYFENVLSVVAGDTGRRIEVQLLDTNGMVQDTTGLNLRLNAEIAGKATYTDATLVDAATGKYQLDLSNGMFLAPGNWQFQWQITDSAGKKLHSFAFTGNVGKNISEGGSQATNFYLNLEDLKAMQEDLVNGTFDSEILETNITEKLTNLETQYAPKLTEVTAQLAQKVGGGKLASMADMGQDVKESMTGGSVAVVGENAVSEPNIVDKQVTPRKLSILVPEGTTSKNLFNKNAVSKGFFYDQSTGDVRTSATRASVIIPVTPSTRLAVQGTAEQYAIKNAAGEYLSGSPAVYNNRIDIPVGGTQLLFNAFITELDKVQVEVAEKHTFYVPYAVVDPNTIKPNSIDLLQTKYPVMLQSDINLFDKAKATVDNYVQYNTGNLAGNTNYYASELIPIWGSIPYEITGETGQWALYNAAGKYLAGAQTAGELKNFQKPADAAFIRISVQKANIDKVRLVSAWKLEPTNITDKALTDIGQRLSILPKVIKVAKDGTGNYTTLRSAIQNATTGTTIELGDGEYSINEEYSVAEINDVNFKGYVKDRGISIKAVNLWKATLSCDLSSADFTDVTRNRVSPVNTLGGGNYEGLIVKGVRCRYALHDDSIRINFDTMNAINCKFYQKNGYLGRAIGGGTWSDSTHIFDHCHFETDAMDVPVDYHNNANFTKPSSLKFIDCTYTTPYEYQIRLQSLGSGTKDTVELIGNRLSKIEMTQTKMDYKVMGRGNRPLTIKTPSVSLRPEIDFVEEVAFE